MVKLFHMTDTSSSAYACPSPSVDDRGNAHQALVAYDAADGHASVHVYETPTPYTRTASGGGTAGQRADKAEAYSTIYEAQRRREANRSATGRAQHAPASKPETLVYESLACDASAGVFPLPRTIEYESIRQSIVFDPAYDNLEQPTVPTQPHHTVIAGPSAFPIYATVHSPPPPLPPRKNQNQEDKGPSEGRPIRTVGHDPLYDDQPPVIDSAESGVAVTEQFVTGENHGRIPPRVPPTPRPRPPATVATSSMGVQHGAYDTPPFPVFTNELIYETHMSMSHWVAAESTGRMVDDANQHAGNDVTITPTGTSNAASVIASTVSVDCKVRRISLLDDPQYDCGLLPIASTNSVPVPRTRPPIAPRPARSLVPSADAEALTPSQMIPSSDQYFDSTARVFRGSDHETARTGAGTRARPSGVHSQASMPASANPGWKVVLAGGVPSSSPSSDLDVDCASSGDLRPIVSHDTALYESVV